MTALRVLYVAYPLLTVSQESAGGAEQVLWALEREMASRGLLTTVAASSGSQVSGELAATGVASSQPDDFERRSREHEDQTVDLIRRRALAGEPFDLVHDMSGSFWLRAAEIDCPVLATLHLPRHFYSPQLFENVAANVSFNCVSESQMLGFTNIPGLEGVIPNGIALDLFAPAVDAGSRNGLLWLGRICEEKAPHLAIQIAERGGLPLYLAGQVYPFSYHREYFEREIVPQLSRPSLNFIDSPSIAMKRRLLREAQAVLITSQVDETSSLVAMEAAASGTPVIAFRRGALPEVVREGITGWLVNDLEEAVDALSCFGQIDSKRCVRHARRHFSSYQMAEGYLLLYNRVLHKGNRLRMSLRDDRSSIPAV